jgi:hypothetical protein
VAVLIASRQTLHYYVKPDEKCADIGVSVSGGDGTLVYGTFGVIVSWGWIFGQMILLLVGYRSIRRIGQDEKFFARIVLTPVVLSWLITIGTIGDHRFRVPTMSMSIFLQVAAFLAIRKKLNERVG